MLQEAHPATDFEAERAHRDGKFVVVLSELKSTLQDLGEEIRLARSTLVSWTLNVVVYSIAFPIGAFILLLGLLDQDISFTVLAGRGELLLIAIAILGSASVYGPMGHPHSEAVGTLTNLVVGLAAILWGGANAMLIAGRSFDTNVVAWGGLGFLFPAYLLGASKLIFLSQALRASNG